jgi:hypothetical protein
MITAVEVAKPGKLIYSFHNTIKIILHPAE